MQMATATSDTTIKGGAWLIEETDPATVMTPEKITDEHRMIGRTAAEFIEGDVIPATEQLEKKDWKPNTQSGLKNYRRNRRQSMPKSQYSNQNAQFEWNMPNESTVFIASKKL
jgi:hypothetical protein